MYRTLTPRKMWRKRASTSSRTLQRKRKLEKTRSSAIPKSFVVDTYFDLKWCLNNVTEFEDIGKMLQSFVQIETAVEEGHLLYTSPDMWKTRSFDLSASANVGLRVDVLYASNWKPAVITDINGDVAEINFKGWSRSWTISLNMRKDKRKIAPHISKSKSTWTKPTKDLVKSVRPIKPMIDALTKRVRKKIFADGYALPEVLNRSEGDIMNLAVPFGLDVAIALRFACKDVFGIVSEYVGTCKTRRYISPSMRDISYGDHTTSQIRVRSKMSRYVRDGVMHRVVWRPSLIHKLVYVGGHDRCMRSQGKGERYEQFGYSEGSYSVYSGEFRKDYREGEGCEVQYNNGVWVERYKGEFKKDLRHGQGKSSKQNDQGEPVSFEGKFQYGRPTGNGKMTFGPEGAYSVEGQFIWHLNRAYPAPNAVMTTVAPAHMTLPWQESAGSFLSSGEDSSSEEDDSLVSGTDDSETEEEESD